MSDPTITYEIDGETYAGQIATVKKTALGFQDHGILTAWLHCEWPSGGIGVGGYCLDVPEDREDYKNHNRQGTAYGLDHIIRLIETVGVDRWEAIAGKDLVILFKGQSLWGSTASGIAGITSGKTFLLKPHADAWRAKSGAEVSA